MPARRLAQVGAQIDHVVMRYDDGASCSCGEHSAAGEDPVEWARVHIGTKYVSWWVKHPEVHPRRCGCGKH